MGYHWELESTSVEAEKWTNCKIGSNIMHKESSGGNGIYSMK